MNPIRHVANALAVALAIALAGALGACSHRDPAPVSGLDLTADVDPVHGTVVEPTDRFRASADDDAVTQDAMQVAMSLCAKEKGVTWVPVFMDTTYTSSPPARRRSTPSSPTRRSTWRRIRTCDRPGESTPPVRGAELPPTGRVMSTRHRFTVPPSAVTSANHQPSRSSRASGTGSSRSAR